jgi:hypothetical protein
VVSTERFDAITPRRTEMFSAPCLPRDLDPARLEGLFFVTDAST